MIYGHHNTGEALYLFHLPLQRAAVPEFYKLAEKTCKKRYDMLTKPSYKPV